MTSSSPESIPQMKSTAAKADYRSLLVPRVEAILAPHDLLGAYGYVRDENWSNELPYHNLHHTHCLIINCAEGAAEMQLPPQKWRVLLLAAAFHDFGHSGGREKDHQNIKVAIAGFEAFASANRIFDDCLTEVIQVIESTEFPPVNQAVTLSEKIIRDADMMQIYMPGWHEQILEGLRKEIEIATGKQMSLAEMVRLQVKFMAGATWQTSWATRRAKDEWPRLIEEVKRFDVAR